MEVGEHIIPQATQFKYFNFVKLWRNRIRCKLSNSSWVTEIEEDFRGFMSRKGTSKVEGFFYRFAIRPTMLYET